MLQHHFSIERVVTTVDAVNGPAHLSRHPVSQKQVVLADTIIVTKTDLVSPGSVAPLLVRLRQLNPTAQLTTAVLGDVDPQWLVEPGPSSIAAARTTGELLSETLPMAPPIPDALSHHAKAIRSITLTFTQPLDWIAFSIWLSMLLHAHGEDVLRVKGLLNVGATGPVVLNGVQHILHAPEHLASWPGEDQRSHLVFILHTLDPDGIHRSLQAFQHLLGARPAVDAEEFIPSFG
jgi:G3E family GTPase